jgi:RNase P protein component
LGVKVSRRDGGAVSRNLFKRRVREIFRLNKHRLARGWDIVVAAKTGRPQTVGRASPTAGPSGAEFPPAHGEMLADFLELTRSLSASGPQGTT